MKSIIQKKEFCLLCWLLNETGAGEELEEHHVFPGTANRKLSEKYGLKVYLCINHHRTGRRAVHNDAMTAALVKELAQTVFEQDHRRQEWMKIFGKNYRRNEMNKVILMGRLTRDPEVRYSQSDTSMAIARYSIAVDRRQKQGEQTADFINCVAFGKAGEFVEKYFRKGMKIAVTGRIQTGSYTNKDGQKVYTTDVVVEEQEFAESKGNGGNTQQGAPSTAGDGFMNIPDGIDEEIPFA